MKTVFNWPAGLAVLSLSLAGCIDFAADDGGSSETDGACEDGCPTGRHGLSGELMLFANGRATSAEGQYQTNIPLAQGGTYLGSAIYLYDPDAVCDDGGTACRMVELGKLALDESMGELSVGDGSLKKFVIRDIAWSPTQGLWAVTYDVLNDEWAIAEITVPDWHATGQRLGIERYTILPGDPQAAGTDPCYWQENVSGLAFFGDELLLGVRGLGGTGIRNDGLVFRVDLDVIREQGWCEYENDISRDPHYYACDVLCEPWADFGPALGVAGDLEVAPDRTQLLALARAEDEHIMPLDRQAIYTVAPPAGEPTTPLATGLYVEGIAPGLDIEGLARVDGVLFGIDVAATLWRFDEGEGAVSVLEDLASHFEEPELSVRIRGATTVTVPPGDG
ncbi:MAG: hypothetical protein IAG13_37630 [Deltaproteobacteria bacterium]|nr:hypothetical protein [Nannocystaceae bacterium]